MALGFHSYRNAPLRFRLDTTIQMLLGTPLNKKPRPKRCMKSSLYRSFCQIHQRGLSDDDKFCMDLFFQAQASRPKPAGQREMWRSLWYIRPALPAPRRKNQTLKTPLLWVEFKPFLWKNLGDSRISVYTTWSCIKQALCVFQTGSVQADTLLAVQEWRDFQELVTVLTTSALKD